jgi:hypothetical protein
MRVGEYTANTARLTLGELYCSTMHRLVASGFPFAVVVTLLIVTTGCRSLKQDQRISDALRSDKPYAYVNTYFKVRSKDCRLSLPTVLTDSAPAWNAAGGENPRLLPARAILLARRALAKTFLDAARWSLDSVALREIPVIDPLSGLPISTGKWYYEICFRPPEEGIHTSSSNVDAEYPVAVYRILVLLNGMVVEPKPIAKVESGNRRD